MRRPIRIVLTALLALVPAAAEEKLDDLLTALQVVPLGDQPAKPFSLEPLGGKPITLAELRGRVVLLYFWESG